MFGRNRGQQYSEEARQYVRRVKPEVNAIVAMADGYVDKAMAELYASLYLLHLARGTVDLKYIRPYLGDAMLDSMEYFQVEPWERQKRLDYVYLAWDTMAQDEKAYRKKGLNPVAALLKSSTLKSLVEIGAKKPDFLACVKGRTNILISRLNLTDYSRYSFPSAETLTAAEKAAEAAKQAAGNTRTAGNAKQRSILLRNESGQEVMFQILDVIPAAGKKFACLLAQGANMLTILEMKDRPDGNASYISVQDESMLDLLFELFKMRNPQMVK